MNIIIVCYIYPPESAAAGKMVQELSEDLAVAGHRVTVITAFPNHPKGVLFDGWTMRRRQWEEGRGFRILRVAHTTSPDRGFKARFRFYTSFAINSLRAGLRLGRIDAVLCLSTPVVGSLACWALALLKRAKFYYDIWDIYPEVAVSTGYFPDGKLARLLLKLDTFLCRRAARVITISDGMKRTLLARGLPDRHIATIPVWLDVDEVVPVSRLNDWRREIGIPEDKFVVLYAGTLGIISGAEMMAEVAERLRAHDDIVFLFNCAGEAKQGLEDLARERKLGNMIFLPLQPRERLSEVQSTGDVALVTLKRGKGLTSVPSKALGYMAAARPIIGSVDDDSDTAAWIRKANCGVVIPPEDPQAMVEAILRLRAQTEQREQLGRNGRRFLEQNLSRSSCTAAYEKMLGGNGE